VTGCKTTVEAQARFIAGNSTQGNHSNISSDSALMIIHDGVTYV
jgi:hypothetical protein